MRKGQTYETLVANGSLMALAGYVLSGPVGFVLVRLIHPQPEWVSPEIFSRNYHIIQDIPYYFGFLLISGMLMIFGGIYLKSSDEADANRKFTLLMALCFSVVFSALISFNYICQTTFVRNLALNYRPEYDAALTIFSMSNTLSVAWAIEMWGYAFLGIATALCSVYYISTNKFLTILMIVNGFVSVGSGIFTIVNVDWVMTTVGLVAYFAWNILMILMMVLIYRETIRSTVTK